MAGLTKYLFRLCLYCWVAPLLLLPACAGELQEGQVLKMEWISATIHETPSGSHDGFPTDELAIVVFNSSKQSQRIAVRKDRRGGEGPFKLAGKAATVSYGRSSGPEFIEILPGDSLLLQMSSYDRLDSSAALLRIALWKSAKFSYQPEGKNMPKSILNGAINIDQRLNFQP